MRLVRALLALLAHCTPGVVTNLYDIGYGPTNHSLDVIHSPDEIDLFLHDMAQHESVTSFESIGTTYENRPVYALTISDNQTANYQVLECGVHAREWISPAFCQMFIYELLYGNYQHLRKDTRWIIMPILNPDGYAFTGSHAPGYRFNETAGDSDASQLDEYGECKWFIEKDDGSSIDLPCGWRKNRAVTDAEDDRACSIGVDLNRNADFLWPGESLTTPEDHESWRCRATYPGLAAADQAETKARDNQLVDKWDQIDVYFAIHSAVDCIYVPHGFGPAGNGDYWAEGTYMQNYTNHDDMVELALNMIEYMKRHPLDITQNVIDNASRIESERKQKDSSYYGPYHTKVETALCGWEADITGASDDWAKSMGATYAYTIEMPPADGTFHPPPHFLLGWLSQYMRMVEASYRLIGQKVTFDNMMKGIPEPGLSEPDNENVVKETFVQEHRSKLGFLGLLGLIGFALSGYYGRQAKMATKKLEQTEERLSLMRSTMIKVHPDLKHLNQNKDPTLDMHDNWEAEIMQPYFEVTFVSR